MASDLYDEWNSLLLKEYFGPANDGEQVWIQTTREELDDFGYRHGGADGLLEAIRMGPAWSAFRAENIAVNVSLLIRERTGACAKRPGYRDPGSFVPIFQYLDAPTYMPYVALFVLAASEVGAGGYYATISELSGSCFESSEESRDLLHSVWDDLSKWTEDLAGEYGRFNSLRIGKHAYVGLAKAQALITQKDRVELPRIFSRLGLKPAQPLTHTLLSQIAESVAYSEQCSNGLRQACTDLSTYELALEEIFAARINEWEGDLRHRVSKARRQIRSASSRLQLVLEDSFDGWALGWRSRLEGSLEAANVDILESRFEGAIDPIRGQIIYRSSSTHSQQQASQLLVEAVASSCNVTAEIQYAGDERLPKKVTFELPHVSVRGLCWIDTAGGSGTALAESGLPVAGPLYLLSKQEELKSNLSDELRSRLISIEQTEGLPPEWCLSVIEQVENLRPSDQSALQRLIGDDQGVGDLARISFFGGCVIQRAGGRMYLDYDLPHIEAQMPPDAKISCEGLVLTEIPPQKGQSPEKNRTCSRHYSVVREEHSARLQFEIVVTQGSKKVSKKLKIAAESGGAVGLHKTFSVGVYGEPSLELDGLRGYRLPMAEAASQASHFERYLKPDLSDQWRDEPSPTESIHVQFMDALAFKGSLLFGEAKQLISRLNLSSQEKWVSPITFLYDLRALGHLEIETDQKGHLIRIHACEPSIYAVCEKAQSSQTRWRFTGTFRQIVWINLHRANEVRVLKQRGLLNIFWEASDSGSLSTFARANGFSLSANPATAILRWAGSISGLRPLIESRSLAERSRPSNLERFNPGQARFNMDVADSMKVDPLRQVELFRLDDPIIPAMRMYMLGSISDAGHARFSYIEDSSWAIWLAFTSFVGFASTQIPDLSPWPLCYRAQTHALLLPARLRLPSVLERALCACAGLLPKRFDCLKAEAPVGDRFELLCRNSLEKIARIPALYADMAEGPWLIYEGVPEEIAIVLAEKMECTLWVEE